MRNTKLIVLISTLALIGIGAAAIHWLQTHQRLGKPGIIGTAQPGTLVMTLHLPEHVLEFTSTNVPEAEIVRKTLPRDTSFAQRCYYTENAADGFWVNANIVLMGLDRTSIHKPEYCLPGQGWRIVEKTNADLAIGGAHPYHLPVAKWVIANTIQDDQGRKQELRGLYVFWFVADNELTTRHWQRAWWLARDLLTKGVLQRWAYVSYFTVCAPGREEATFDRMKKLITASVPKFQLPPRGNTATMASSQ